MTSQILQFEDKTLLFIQIIKYPLEITIWSREQLKRTMMRKKIISGGRDLSAGVFFFFGNEILFSDFSKIFLLSGRRSPIFYGQTGKPQGMFWRHIIEFDSHSHCSEESYRHNS